MKKVGLLLCSFLLWTGVVLAQQLEIHVINVQWGQATFVKGPDGTTVLLEGGGTGKGTNEVVPYLQSIGHTPAMGFNYTIVGHQHCDHMGGLDEVINAGYNVTNANYYNGSTYTSSCVDGWNAASATTTAGSPIIMPVGTVIQLGNGAKITCIARNGQIIGGGSVSVSNENDRSIALLIQYGGFDYIWASDMGGGSDACTGRSTTQVNVETTVIQAISPGGANPLISSGGIDVMHVSHHGSESSTNPDWMNYSQPSLAVISTGAGQSSGWDMPRKDVVENVLLAQATSCITAPPVTLVLQSEEGSPTGTNTSFMGYCVGDMVISTNGSSTYTVSANGSVSQGPDERTAAGLPKTINLDDGTPPPDTTPPVISNVQSTNITSNSATITWTTDEASNSVVEYGLTTSYGSTASDAAMVTSHSINLSGLTANTLYHYRVSSTDGSNNTATSGDFTFTTLSGGGGGGGNVVFSEVFYDPAGTEPNEEWIELYNKATTSTDISGWTITDNNGAGTVYTIPAGTIMNAQSYLTISRDQVSFTALYGYEADIYGTIPALNNDGDALVLKNGGTTIDAVAWEGGSTAGIPAGWGSTTLPNAAQGSTIVRSDVTVDTDTYSDWTTAGSNGFPQTQAYETVPPVISGISESNITSSGATINWTTDEASSSVVEYGTTTSYGSTATGTDGVTSHSVSLTGLTANTLYHYRVRSMDFWGNESISGDGTFTTGGSFNYSPNAVTITSGSITSGTYSNLATDNGSYLQVKSTTSGTRIVDWYSKATISQAASSVSSIAITYNGKNSANRTQRLYLYNFSTSAWTQIDSRTVGNSDVTINYTLSSGASNYVSATGEVRLRVYASHNSSTFTNYGDYVRFTISTSGTPKESMVSIVPDKFDLDQNFPNPFNPSTTIRYQLKEEAFVTLKIYNIVGEEVRTLINDHKVGGNYEEVWDAKNNEGILVSSGMYIYRLKVSTKNGSNVYTKRMTLLK